MSGNNGERQGSAMVQDLEALIELSSEGFPVEMIAAKLGRSVESIRAELRRLAISPNVSHAKQSHWRPAER